MLVVTNRYVQCLWKAPGLFDQCPHWPRHHVHPEKLHNKEHVDALFMAKLKFPRSQESMTPKCGALMPMNLDMMVYAKSVHHRELCGQI